MKRVLLALALLTAGYAAGATQPHARATDNSLIADIAQQLSGIRSELQQIRRLMERSR